MKIYKKKGWEKPNVSILSIKNLTLSGDVEGNEKAGKAPTPAS